MRLNALVASPSFAAWGRGPALDPRAAPARRGRQAARRGRLPRAPLRPGAAARRHARPLAARSPGCTSSPGTSDLRALVYLDEVFGFAPPTAAPPSKKPILDPDEAGARVRDRDGRRDPEPGRPRLQGDGERRQLVRRPAPDRERQGACARGAPLGGGRRRRGEARQGDRRARAAPVPAPERPPRRAGAVLDALGDVVPARPADEGPDRDPHPGRGADRAAAAPPAPDRPAAPRSPTTRAPSPRRSRAGVAVRYLDPAAPWAGRDRRRTPTASGCRRSSPHASASATTTRRPGSTRRQEWEALYGPLDAGLDLDNETAVDYDERDFRPEPPTGATYVLPPRRSTRRRSSATPPARSSAGVADTQALELLRYRRARPLLAPGRDRASSSRRGPTRPRRPAQMPRRRRSETGSRRSATGSSGRSRPRAGGSRRPTRSRRSRQSTEVLSGLGSVVGVLLGGKANTRTIARAGRALGGAASRRGHDHPGGRAQAHRRGAGRGHRAGPRGRSSRSCSTRSPRSTRSGRRRPTGSRRSRSASRRRTCAWSRPCSSGCRPPEPRARLRSRA